MVKTKVTLQIKLTIEHDERKALEDVQGAVYWLLEPFLEEAKTGTYNVNGCQIKEFDIEIKEQQQ